ncbi:MAG: DUF4418 family protein [Eubacteriales bacterium]|nr:DUF4418 family protein [Eubacteriales bacterium]
MKKRKESLVGILTLVISAIFAIGSQTFFQACIHEDGNYGACHYAGRTLTWAGIILVILAVFLVFTKQRMARKGIALSGLVLSLAGMALPKGVIPLCMMDTMRCNLVMRPFALLFLGILAVLFLAEYLMDLKEK